MAHMAYETIRSPIFRPTEDIYIVYVYNTTTKTAWSR